MYSKVLVPLDGSALAEAVLPYAIEIAEKFGAQLVLLRVVGPPGPVWPNGIPAEATPSEGLRAGEMAREQFRAEREEAERYVPSVVARVKTEPLDASGAVVDGVPTDAIVQYANQHGFDLIAMSTHGRGGLGRLVYGSVADGVLRSASCPVLLVRAQEQRESKA